MDAPPTTLKVFCVFDEDTGLNRAVATTGRLQAALYLGCRTDEVQSERREPPAHLALANPGVVFVETSPFSRAYKAQPFRGVA